MNKITKQLMILMETILTQKVFSLYRKVTGNALNLCILFLFVSCAAQKPVQDDYKKIILLELLEHKQAILNQGLTRDQIGDSIILHKQKVTFRKSSNGYKIFSAAIGALDKEEADEIFSKEFIEMPDSTRFWSYGHLPDIEVVLYDTAKYTPAVTLQKSDKIGLATFNILSLSNPMIRADNKYAYIETSHYHFGGVLSIYKNTDKGWVHYKDVQLYEV